MPKDDKYESLIGLCKQKNVDVLQLEAGDKLVADGLEFDCIWPGKNVIGAINPAEGFRIIDI